MYKFTRKSPADPRSSFSLLRFPCSMSCRPFLGSALQGRCKDSDLADYSKFSTHDVSVYSSFTTCFTIYFHLLKILISSIVLIITKTSRKTVVPSIIVRGSVLKYKTENAAKILVSITIHNYFYATFQMSKARKLGINKFRQELDPRSTCMTQPSLGPALLRSCH